MNMYMPSLRRRLASKEPVVFGQTEKKSKCILGQGKGLMKDMNLEKCKAYLEKKVEQFGCSRVHADKQVGKQLI